MKQTASHSLLFPAASVEEIPGLGCRAVITTDFSSVFREESELCPVTLDNGLQYIPWGADNQMPYQVIDMVERDETLSTCQQFNAEVCYGAGLQYNTTRCHPEIARRVEDFALMNDIPSYFLGVCEDFKHFGFAVSVVILNDDRSRIVRILRKEVCYCRFAPQDENGRIPYLLYGNFRDAGLQDSDDLERIDITDAPSLLEQLDNPAASQMLKGKYAIVTRIPTVDSTYYPIPPYASIFRSKWYTVKQLIAAAKEAKLQNSAPIKYHLEVSDDYWDAICREAGATSPAARRKVVAKAKREMLDFLTGAENSGKALFSTFRINPATGGEMHSVKVTRIESAKEGGDWETDIQEAINMVCFTLRVHSNLVGSVPGKSQSNNSGSDKRELYTIAQALQKPYRDLIFQPHRILIRFNGWEGVFPECPFIQLTTLDEHQDSKTVNIA